MQRPWRYSMVPSTCFQLLNRPLPLVDPWSGTRGADARQQFVVPLVVAVTGHRDLLPAEIPVIRDRVRALIAELRESFPDRAIMLMSALAEGADRLAAEVALDAGIPLVAVLPMSRECYAEDFTAPGSRADFDRLCAASADVFELPMIRDGNSAGTASVASREGQYAQCGVFLCAHCHILLALWDGKTSVQMGGTSQVVHFHHRDVMPGFGTPTPANRLTLTDDESDLVYHIVCSRDRPDGSPAEGLQPLAVTWYHDRRAHPRLPRCPRVTAGCSSGRRVRARRAGACRGDRKGMLSAADGRAGRAPAGGAHRHQPRVLRRRLARDPLPEAFHAHAAREPPLCVPHRPRLHLLHGFLLDQVVPVPRARAHARGVRDQPDGQAGRLAPQVPRLPHAGRGAAGAVLLGGGRRHQRQPHQVRARQLPADAGPRTRLDQERHARRGHGIRRPAQQRPGGPRLRVAEWIGDERSGQLGYFLRRTADRIRGARRPTASCAQESGPVPRRWRC